MKLLWAAVLFCLVAVLQTNAASSQVIDDRIFESYPDELLARIEQFNREIVQIPTTESSNSFPRLVVNDLEKWTQKQTVRVAFNGGDPDLYKQIADVAQEWGRYVNLKMDFGFDPTTG